VSLQLIRGSEDPDAALFRQMEQYVLDHYPNPTRTGCPDSQTLKLLVYEPLTLEFRDAKYLHVMECAECMREVIAFRETRMAETGAATPVGSVIPNSSTPTSASSSSPPLRMHRRFGALTLGATAAACVAGGVLIGTHLKPPTTHEAGVRSEVVDLSRDGTTRGIEKGPQSLLSVRGMLEVNYDAAMTSATYSAIETMALQRGHFLVAARARGEQGIADFLTGNIATAKKKVVYAWTVSKLFHDRAAQIRYASMYAEGLAQIGRFQEAQRAVEEAIRTAHDTPNAPYPSMAEGTKVEILTQTGKYAEAFKTLDESEAWALSHHLEGHPCAAEINRGDLWNRMGKSDLAIVGYRRALKYADHLSFWRGFTSTGGSLAKALASEGHLEEALQMIDRALSANTHIPDELYFVPRNLAVKAEILRQMGRIAESNDSYKRSTTLIDSLLTSSPTPGVERLLLADLSDVYSGYFVSLVQQGRNADALPPG
jgi:tetratricopeptide (TPR) repeat protein